MHYVSYFIVLLLTILARTTKCSEVNLGKALSNKTLVLLRNGRQAQ